MHFPKRQDFVYLEGCTLPRDVDPSATFKLSLWHLGWADGCSSKPPTFKITANQLLDEYLTNSVMTAAEPLLLYQGPEDKVYKCSQTKEPLLFSCYVKGAARATSLLMLAHVAMYVLKVDLDAFSPTLFQSMLAVTCRLGIAATDQTSIALENARLSARGSIRKMHDVITWASKLMNLKHKGLSPIRRWNESSTAAAGLTGGKKTSVLALLDLPTDCMEILIQHIQAQVQALMAPGPVHLVHLDRDPEVHDDQGPTPDPPSGKEKVMDNGTGKTKAKLKAKPYPAGKVTVTAVWFANAVGSWWQARAIQPERRQAWTPICKITASALQQQGYSLPRKSANTVENSWHTGIAGLGSNTAGIAGRDGTSAECPELLLKEALRIAFTRSYFWKIQKRSWYCILCFTWRI